MRGEDRARRPRDRHRSSGAGDGDGNDRHHRAARQQNSGMRLSHLCTCNLYRPLDGQDCSPHARVALSCRRIVTSTVRGALARTPESSSDGDYREEIVEPCKISRVSRVEICPVGVRHGSNQQIGQAPPVRAACPRRSGNDEAVTTCSLPIEREGIEQPFDLLQMCDSAGPLQGVGGELWSRGQFRQRNAGDGRLIRQRSQDERVGQVNDNGGVEDGGRHQLTS